MSNKMHKGQSILEVVVALGIIVVVLVGLVRVTTQSVRNTASSQNEALTARYGTEVSEWLKNNKDNLGWVGFIADLSQSPSKIDGTWCLRGPLPNPGSGFSAAFTAAAGCSQISGTNLTRTVTIGPITTLSTRDQQLQFTVDLSWNEGSVARKAEYLTQITSVENP